MSNKPEKQTKIIAGILSLGTLFGLASVPSAINSANEALDRLNGMSTDEIETTYFVDCKKREFSKNFIRAKEDIGEKSPETLLLTINRNTESFKNCPQVIHTAEIKATESYRATDWVVGGMFALTTVTMGYVALRGRKKETPKPQ